MNAAQVLIAVSLGCGAPDAQESADHGRHRGVSWVAGREITPLDIQPLVEANVNWIVQTPFGWQRGVDTPQIRLTGGGGVLWGETDEGLRVTARLARGRGIHTLLKPHLWLTDGSWRGEIRMKTEADWQQWFAAYRRFILHYASFAQNNGIEALCIGTELRGTLEGHEAQWRRIIADVRKAYRGKLTYAANWYAEFEEVPFWDDLDYIGVQAYFPLCEGDDPTANELLMGWRDHLKRIERLRKRFGKPVLFTELGYRSDANSASKPWVWPKRGESVQIDTGLQMRCYDAFFRTFWEKSWFAGVYWWKWYPPHSRAGGPDNGGFTPQNKPAQQIMTDWYGNKKRN